MSQILILLAHPSAEKSRIHRELVKAATNIDGVSVNSLYTEYPDFVIDVAREQEMLRVHQHIIMQHPLYWYSSPALLKQWQDMVLDYGFAYGGGDGDGGRALAGKTLRQVVTTGGAAHAFTGEGDSCTMEEILKPFEQTARKCSMRYLTPYIIHNAGRLDESEIASEAARYGEYLQEIIRG